MQFIKMHGCGNDYVLVDGFEYSVDNPHAAALALCNRHFGIGADGFIVVEPSEKAHGRMRIFNSDGSEAEMCGNGIRCVARFLFERGGRAGDGPAGDEVVIDTLAGLRTITRHFKNDLETFNVNMGKAVFFARDGQCLVPASKPEELQVETGTISVTGVPLSVGNPHFVMFVDDVDACPVCEWGPAIERLPVFEKGTNVEFVQIRNRGRFRQRTWERGAGETLACGTGASAAAAVALALKKTGNPVEVELLGGKLTLSVNDEGAIFMQGEAVEVFRGETRLC